MLYYYSYIIHLILVRALPCKMLQLKKKPTWQASCSQCISSNSIKFSSYIWAIQFGDVPKEVVNFNLMEASCWFEKFGAVAIARS